MNAIKIKFGWGMITYAIILPFICLSFSSCITINQIAGTERLDIFIDPVCGKKVDSSSVLKAEYDGQIYYFDAIDCQKVFLKNPGKFADNESSKQNYSIWDGSHMGLIGGSGAVLVMVAIMTTLIIFGGMH